MDATWKQISALLVSPTFTTEYICSPVFLLENIQFLNNPCGSPAIHNFSIKHFLFQTRLSFKMLRELLGSPTLWAEMYFWLMSHATWLQPMWFTIDWHLFAKSISAVVAGLAIRSILMAVRLNASFFLFRCQKHLNVSSKEGGISSNIVALISGSALQFPSSARLQQSCDPTTVRERCFLPELSHHSKD